MTYSEAGACVSCIQGSSTRLVWLEWNEGKVVRFKDK